MTFIWPYFLLSLLAIPLLVLLYVLHLAALGAGRSLFVVLYCAHTARAAAGYGTCA